MLGSFPSALMSEERSEFTEVELTSKKYGDSSSWAAKPGWTGVMEEHAILGAPLGKLWAAQIKLKIETKSPIIFLPLVLLGKQGLA